ncbi:DUF4124 domain-containing protein [Halomonas sp.]
MLPTFTANADIYKCVVDGHTTYQDTPCFQGAVPMSDNGTFSIITLPTSATRLLVLRIYQPAKQFLCISAKSY